MPATRVLPTEEATALLGLVREIAERELLPAVAEAEATETFPREMFRTLGRAGLLGLPYPEEYGGGGQPYEVYLQVVEEIATVWASVGVGVSVHALSCFGLATCGTEEQRQEWLPEMLGGELLGAYCLSEAARRLRPVGDDDPRPARRRRLRDQRRQGLDHARRPRRLLQGDGPHRRRAADGISCFLVPADSEGLSADPPERKMGLTGSATATMRFDDVRVPADRLLGEEGDGLKIALAGLDSGRLGIAAVATGLGPGRRSTTRSPTPRSARRSASGSSTSRASASCSPTWRPASRAPAR